MFQIDFTELSKQLIRFERLRKPKTIALLSSYIESLRVIYDDLLEFRAFQKVELSYDCQVGLMELMLNRHYGIDYSLALRASDISAETIISIDNSYLNIPHEYIFRKADSRDGTTIRRDTDVQASKYIHRDIDFSSTYDFIVKCPATIILDEEGKKEVEALVNKVSKGRMKYIVINY